MGGRGIVEGQSAPMFSLPDKSGENFELAEVSTPWLVLYFYPKDNTPGCTLEARGFQERLQEFKKLGATVIGISGGDEKSKTKFCDKNQLTFPVLSDTDFSVSRSYGVYGEKKFMGKVFNGIRRETFLIDQERIIRKHIAGVSSAKIPKHVLECLKELSSSSA